VNRDTAAGPTAENASAAEAHGRAFIYRFLSRVLEREVDAALLDQAGRLVELGLLQYRPLHENLEHLAVDYCRLFVLPERGLAPYQSVQSVENQLWGERAGEMSAYLSRLGLAPARGFLPDHAAVQLAVMAQLIERQSRVGAGDGSQATLADIDIDRPAQFFRSFLRWLPEYFERVATYAETAFYRAAASLGSAYLRQEEQRVAAPE
jgi:TorA maturation chaperone TorD